MLELVFVLCCSPPYDALTDEETGTSFASCELDSAVHFVQSWLQFRRNGGYTSTTELEQACQQSDSQPDLIQVRLLFGLIFFAEIDNQF